MMKIVNAICLIALFAVTPCSADTIILCEDGEPYTEARQDDPTCHAISGTSFETVVTDADTGGSAGGGGCGSSSACGANSHTAPEAATGGTSPSLPSAPSGGWSSGTPSGGSGGGGWL